MLERAPAFGESQTTSADTLVFRRRNVITDTRPALRPLVKAIPWATLVLVLAIPVVVLLTVAQRHPDGWPAAWPALLDIWRKEPLRWLGMAGQLLLMPVIVWVVLSGGWAAGWCSTANGFVTNPACRFCRVGSTGSSILMECVQVACSSIGWGRPSGLIRCVPIV